MDAETMQSGQASSFFSKYLIAPGEIGNLLAKVMRWKGFWIWGVLTIFSFIPLHAQENDVAVFIGDMHGHLNGLIHILKELNLVDEAGNWTGGKTRLYFVGDLIHKGPYSKAVLLYYMQLQTQALEAGGSLSSTVGNHEVYALRGEYSSDDPRLSEFDLVAFERELGHSRGRNIQESLDPVFRQDSDVSRFLLGLPFVLHDQKTGSLVVHGSFTSRLLLMPLDEINRRGAVALREAQRGNVAHSDAWMVGERGPLFSRAMVQTLAEGPPRSSEAPRRAEWEGWLKQNRFRRLIVGHTKMKEISMSPYYGDSLMMIDTAMASALQGQGRLSALVVTKGVAQPRYFNSPAFLYPGTKERIALCTLPLRRLVNRGTSEVRVPPEK